MAKKPETTPKTSHLLIDDDVPAEIIQLHKDTQELGRDIMRWFLAALGRPVDDEILIPAECAEDARIFAESVLQCKGLPGDKSLTTPESCAAVLLAATTKSGLTSKTRTRQQKLMKTALKEQWGWETLRETLSKKSALWRCVPLETWEQFYHADDLNGFGRLLMDDYQRPAMDAAWRLRNAGVLPLDSRGYDSLKLCGILASAAARLKSWRACDAAVRNRKELLRETYENKLAELDPVLYERFCDFAAKLWDAGYGITRRLVTGVKRKRAGCEVALTLLQDYPEIEADFDELAHCYMDWRNFTEAPESAQVTLCGMGSPIRFPFGQTARGYHFTLAACGQRFNVVIQANGQNIPLNCRPSKYFRDPVVTPEGKNFHISFRRGRTPIEGVIKEPSLLCKNGKYYFSMVVNVATKPIPADVQEAVQYYRAASGDGSPAPLRILNVDLGLDPVAGWSVVDTNVSGDCGVFGGGTAAFVASGRIGMVRSRGLHGDVRQLAEKCYQGVRYIRLSKKLQCGDPLNIREAGALPRYTEGFGITHYENGYARKDAIGLQIRDVLAEFRRLRHQHSRRDHPDNRDLSWETISAESFQMLRLTKNLCSLLKSWGRYTRPESREVIAGELTSYWAYYNGLRRDLQRKTINAIITLAKQHNAQVVCVEDFNLTDRDDVIKSRRENTLWSLFAPGELVTKLEESLGDEGIALVKVDPRHTSQLAAGTGGLWGWRPKPEEYGCFNKHDFFWKENGVIKHRNSDINAAMTIGERWLLRHSVPSHVWAAPLDDGTYVVDPGDGKRMPAFVQRTTGCRFAKLVPVLGGYRLEGLSSKPKVKAKVQHFYNHGEVWLNADSHFAARDELGREVRCSRNTPDHSHKAA